MIDVVAHRGDSWSELENTLPAFRSAISHGVDVVELDARVSADEVAVVIHDATLSRLWGVPRRVDQLTAAEIAAVSSAGIGIPTLAEALHEFTGGTVRVMVDLPSADRIEVIIATVLAHPARPLVLWSGADEPLRAVRAADPHAVIIAHDFDSGLDPAMINMDGSTLVAQDAERAHADGLGLSVWTIDSPDAMRWLISQGVDSITTNRIDLLLAVRAEDPSAANPPVDAELARCHDVAVALAHRAIRTQRSASGFSVDTKANAADLVTDVDRGIERMVRDVLAAEFADHTIVGEEYGGTAGAGPTWYCDPIDGTTNFANGLRWSSFSLALVVEDRVVVAAIGDTITGEVFSAVAGAGAHVNGTALRAEPTSLPGSLVLTELAGAGMWPGMPELFTGLSAVGATARVMGSGTLALALPAAGRAVAGTVHRFHPIDHAASLLISLEAGCELLDRDGDSAEPLVSQLIGHPVVITAPGLARELQPILANLPPGAWADPPAPGSI